MRSRLSISVHILAVLAILTALYSAGASANAALPDLPVVVQTGPPYYLDDPTYTDAPYEPFPPIIDGILSPGEYGNAARLVFDGYGGDIEVYILQTGGDLVIAFNSHDQTPYPYVSDGGTGPAFQVFLDTLNDRSSLPQADDYRLTLLKNNTIIEAKGNSSGWSGIPPTLWQAVSRVVPWGWQGEFAISFTKLGLASPSQQVLGFSMAEVWTPSWPFDWYWPAALFTTIHPPGARSDRPAIGLRSIGNLVHGVTMHLRECLILISARRIGGSTGLVGRFGRIAARWLLPTHSGGSTQNLKACEFLLQFQPIATG